MKTNLRRSTAAVRQLPVAVVTINHRFRGHMLILIFLLLVSVITALGVIYSSYMNRQLFNELHQLEQRRDDLQVEWGQLSLDQTTWTSHNHVDELVKQSLDMVIPSPADIIVVRY